MRQLKSLKVLLVCFVLVFFTSLTEVNAAPRGVNLAEELRLASVVIQAQIIAYESGSLRFQPIGSTALISVKYSTDPNWKPGILTEWPPKDQEEGILTVNEELPKVILTAQWPPVGADVLVVLDKENEISLFAWSNGQRYRFWSPLMTGSVAIFDCKTLGGHDNRWDGCLVDKSRIITTDTWATLPWAIVHSDANAVEMLLNQGADIELKDSYSRTPLQLAFDFDKFDIARLLIKMGADITVKDVNGRTLLHNIALSFLSREFQALEAIKLLVEEMDVGLINAKDKDGKTAFEFILEKTMGLVVEGRVIKWITPFVTHGADMETTNWGDWEGLAPFQRMIFNGWLNAARLLLENGAKNINAKDKSGRTALNILVEHYHSRINNKTDVIEFLLERGADANIPNNEGITPLHQAALKGSVGVARMLLKHGADPLIKDKSGQTPIDKARLIGNTAMVGLLTTSD